MDDNTWQQHVVYVRDDGSYIITVNEYPYHVPDMEEYAELYANVRAWAAEHPEKLEAEPLPPRPSAQETLEARMAAIRARLSSIDAESIRPLRAIADGTATEEDRAKLARLESEAAGLRAELAG